MSSPITRWLGAACMLAVVAALVGGLMTISGAGQKHARSVKVARATGKQTTLRGEDPNVKQDEAKNSATAGKNGGLKARGRNSVILHVNNHTRLYIKLYNNGDYIGTVGPFGDSYYYAEPGTHTMYARADFDDGSVKTWGPSTYEIDTSFEWNLY